MKLLKTISDLHAAIGASRPAFVPTMGALHEGHLALIRRARGLADSGSVVVSIFVNPTQFGPNEDFSRYPRTLEADLAGAESAGADCAFVPAVATVYPPDEPVATPPLPAVATEPQLEDAHRKTHFAGVCQVVSRLFDLIRPSIAVFGEKDYQQLLVIQSMVEADRRRWPGLAIVSHPTVREPDGLAMSSRNRYLQSPDRERGLGLSRALSAAAGEPSPAAAEQAMRTVLEKHGLAIDYAVVRDAATLMPVRSLDGASVRALVAARLGTVRLIDNRALK